jgi:hypothetical protein
MSFIGLRWRWPGLLVNLLRPPARWHWSVAARWARPPGWTRWGGAKQVHQTSIETEREDPPLKFDPVARPRNDATRAHHLAPSETGP